MSEQTIDHKIQLFMNKIETQEKEVEQANQLIAKNWKTKCSFNILGTHFNLRTANKESIVLMFSHILFLKHSFDEANQLLGTKVAFKLDVDSFEDIKEDFQKRLAILDIKEKKDKLDKMKQKLDSIASEDLKRQKILKEIEEDFNSDFN